MKNPLAILAACLTLIACAQPIKPSSEYEVPVRSGDFNIASDQTSFTSQESGTRSVLVTGVGNDIQQAKEDAVRNAVQSVVGAYVSSDLVMRDRQLVKDQVLSYSAGYVTRLEVLSQQRDLSGLYRVKVRAEVSREKVKRKLDELRIATNAVDGNSLFAESLSTVDRQDNARRIITRLLESYPQGALVAKVSKPTLVSSSGAAAQIAVQYRLAWDQEYIQEFSAAMVAIGGQEKTLGCGSNHRFSISLGLKSVCLTGDAMIEDSIHKTLLGRHPSTSQGFYTVPIQMKIMDGSDTVLARWVFSAVVGCGQSVRCGGRKLVEVQRNQPQISATITIACTHKMEIPRAYLARATKVHIEVLPREQVTSAYMDLC